MFYESVLPLLQAERACSAAEAEDREVSAETEVAGAPCRITVRVREGVSPRRDR